MKNKIDKEFGVYRYFHPPLNKISSLLSLLLWKEKIRRLKTNHDLNINKIKIQQKENQIECYYFKPKKETKKIMLYLHGGGFVFKGYSSFPKCIRYAKEGNCKVLYVDYHLAPKFKYPTQIEECYLAYEWLVKNKKKLEIDLEELIIAGDSAGGLLAVEVTRKIIEKTKNIPKLLLLIYPTLDKRMNTASMKKFKNTPMWNAKKSKKMWKLYLGEKEYLSPNEREDYENFPETYIEVADIDALKDEGIEFKNILERNKVKVTLEKTLGTMHGYDVKDTKITEEQMQKRLRKIKVI